MNIIVIFTAKCGFFIGRSKETTNMAEAGAMAGIIRPLLQWREVEHDLQSQRCLNETFLVSMLVGSIDVMYVYAIDERAKGFSGVS